MAPEEGGAISELRNTTGGGMELKKGPWTAEEDAVLAEFVGKHGEGNWNNVGRRAGLMRCGKSCRLRWINHLRSNLKKGSFTPQEESKIIRLHAKFGNRWSLIALHLPGRTDNEIKNFWNTRLKKLVRLDLPVYPPEVIREHKHLHLPHHQRPEKPIQNQIRPSSSSSFSSLHKVNSDFCLIPSSSSSSNMENPNFRLIPSSSSSSHTKNPNFNFIPFSSSSSSPPQANLEFSSIPSSSSSPHDQTNHQFNPIPTLSLMDPIMSNQLRSALYHPDSNCDKDGGVALFPLPSQNLHLSSSPIPLFDQSQLAPYDMNPMPTMGASFRDAFLYENFEIEIPSIQSSFQAIMPTSSSTKGNDHVIVLPNGEDNYNADPELIPERNTYSGLLQDVVGQSRALLRSRLHSEEDKQTKDDQSEFKGTIMHDDAIFIMNVPESNMNLDSVFGSSGNDKTPMEDSSYGFSSIDMGVTSQAHVFEDLNIMEDDFLSWIDFQPTGPPQELNQGSDEVATIPVEADHDWEISSYYWNNMPPRFS